MYRTHPLSKDFVIRLATDVAPELTIPLNPLNSDYQEFQRWIAEGNELENSQPTVSLEQAKQQVKGQVKAFAAQLRNQVIGNVSPGETASWIRKEDEAERFQSSGNPNDAPLLLQEATIRQRSLEDLAAIVLANAEQFRKFEAMVAGVRGRHDDAVDRLATVEDVLAYNWRQGWMI